MSWTWFIIKDGTCGFRATAWQLNLAATSTPPSQFWLRRTILNKSGRPATSSWAGKSAGDRSLCMELYDALRGKTADKFKSRLQIWLNVIQDPSITRLLLWDRSGEGSCSVMLLLVSQKPKVHWVKLPPQPFATWQRFPFPTSLPEQLVLPEHT